MRRASSGRFLPEERTRRAARRLRRRRMWRSFVLQRNPLHVQPRGCRGGSAAARRQDQRRACIRALRPGRCVVCGDARFITRTNGANKIAGGGADKRATQYSAGRGGARGAAVVARLLQITRHRDGPNGVTDNLLSGVEIISTGSTSYSKSNQLALLIWSVRASERFRTRWQRPSIIRLTCV